MKFSPTLLVFVGLLAAAGCFFAAAKEDSTSEVNALLERTGRSCQNGDTSEALKCYRAAVQLENTQSVRRRFAEVFYASAEALRLSTKPELDASLANLEATYNKATKRIHSMVQGADYDKLNSKDPAFLAALDKHHDLLKRISVCFPFYDAAEENFAAVQRLAPQGKDFDAAARQPMCLIYKSDVATRAKARLLLVAFLKNYKPSTPAEESLYDTCQKELDKRDQGL